MNHLPPPVFSRFSPAPTTGPLAALFAVIMKGFCDTIDMRSRHGRFPVLLAIAITGRLQRLAGRIEALTAKLRAGTLRPPPRRPARSRKPQAGPPPHPWNQVRPSRAFGWLGQHVPEARTWAGHLERWLAEPEAAALLHAAPQAARLLRPLCHMAGLRPDPALLPPRPRRPRRPAPPPAEPAATSAPGEPAAPPPDRPPDRAARRAEARAAARAEARWAAAYRRSLGLRRRE